MSLMVQSLLTLASLVRLVGLAMERSIKKLFGIKYKIVTVIFVAVIFLGIFYGHLAGVTAAPSSENLPSALIEESFEAVVTQYSYADSCHSIQNGKCLMASGKVVYTGAVACPNFLELGTKVIVNGEVYTCEDRYASWLDQARDYPTVDVFVESLPKGNKVETVTVIRG